MRLPVNLLLYVTSAALLGFAGYTFQHSLKESSREVRQKASEDGIKQAEDLLSKGKGSGPATSTWNYQTNIWRARFLAPNLVGKEIRKPDEVETAAQAQEPVVRADIRPVSEIIELVSLMCDTKTEGKGGQSHVIVRYKNTSNVQPPAWYLLENQAPSPAAAAADAVRPTRATNRSGRPGQPGRPPVATPMPTSSAGQEYLQRVWVAGDGSPRNEAVLWPPYDDIRLVRVAGDARSAYFVRKVELPAGPDGQPSEAPAPVEEEVFKTSMEIGDDVMKAIVDLQRSGDLAAAATVRPEQGAAAPTSGWQDYEETTLVGSKVFVSKKDQRLLQEAPETFMDRIHVDTYVSRTGSGMRGLRVLNVAPEMSARFGVQSNDLILSINGESVSTKADAIAVGKRQYNRGVRTFIVRMLSDGREVERVIEAPDR